MRTYFPPLSGRNGPVRVLLTDDHDLVRAGIRALLKNMAEVQVVAEASDGHELLAQMALHAPELVICDISMPHLDGLAALVELRARHPDVRVLVLSMYDTVDFVRRAVAAGANGYLMKRSAPEELPRAVRSILQVGSYFGTEITHKLLQPAPPTPQDELTERQLQVLVLVAQGLSAKEIGQRLNLSPKTVDVHRSRAMERVQARDIAGLTRYAVRNGLIAA